MTNRDLGRRGEDEAVRFLKKRGYRILVRNYRTKAGEIDIIARENRALVFLEVKTRSSLAFGSPAEAVVPRRRSRLKKAAQWYLLANRLSDCPCRMEVVSILWNDDPPVCEIIPVE